MAGRGEGRERGRAGECTAAQLPSCPVAQEGGRGREGGREGGGEGARQAGRQGGRKEEGSEGGHGLFKFHLLASAHVSFLVALTGWNPVAGHWKVVNL